MLKALSADAGWLSDEAAANIASTTIAALATNTYLTSLGAADVAYINAAAPLIKTATQAFNNAVDAAYTAAFPGDTDLAAVSGEWTQYYNAMATAAEVAMNSEASAFQTYINTMSGDVQTWMNDVAGESTQLATDYGNALTSYVSTVAAAATLATSQTTAAGVAWVDSVATNVKNAIQNATTAWKQMADDDVDAAKDLADDYSNFWNGFMHSYIGAAVPHAENIINEDRQAAKDADAELTTLAQGVAAEQHDLNLDGLDEGKSTALSLSSLDDAVFTAWAALESAWSVLYAWEFHISTLSAPLSDFSGWYVGGASPMSGINHAFDLAGDNDEVVMQAAVAATSQGSSWTSWLPWNWSVFSWGDSPPAPVNGATKMGEQEGLANNWKKRRDLMLENGIPLDGLQDTTATAGGLGGAALDSAEDTAVNLAMTLAGAGAADDAFDAANTTRKAAMRAKTIGRTLRSLDGVPWGRYCRFGCEDVATKIHSVIGGTVATILVAGPNAGRLFLGRRGSIDTQWYYHQVVVKSMMSR